MQVHETQSDIRSGGGGGGGGDSTAAEAATEREKERRTLEARRDRTEMGNRQTSEIHTWREGQLSCPILT